MMDQDELSIKLIEGIFDVADANLLLLELLRFKIGFHDQKLFRDYGEFNRDNSNSKRRIEVLNRSLKDVRQLMAMAKAAGSEIEIDCTIHIHVKP